jgi:kynureninase
MADLLDADIRDRYRFPDEPDAVELRAFTHGLQPETVPAMMERFTEDWRRFGVDAWNEVPNHWAPESGDRVGWWTLPEYLGDTFVAPLLGATDGTCILQPNVHWTVQCLLSAPELTARGREVVVPETAFPSVLHSAKQWESLAGFSPTVVPPTDAGRVDRDAVLRAIGPETGLVALSHVGFTTGARLTDGFLRTVADAAEAAGALFLVDGYHSAGTFPIDVRALGCDVYVGGLLKETSGSSGNAYAYLREGLELTPRLTGWFGDAAPFAFRPAPEPHDDVRRRFLGGTTAVASMYHAVEGVRILLDAGLEAVRRHSLALTRRAIERADTLGLPLRSPRAADRRSAMVLVEVDGAEGLAAALKERGIYTDSRRDEVLRLSPFVWNTPEEVDRTFDAVDAVLSSGAHRSAARNEPGPVT